MDDVKTQTNRGYARLLSVMMIARFVHDTAVRVVYPFAPEIAAGLRVSAKDFGAIVSLRTAAAFFSPVLGAVSDRIGYRPAMVTGLIALSVGLAVIGFAQSVFAAIIAFVISGLGSALYLPAQQAYVSERVPYAQRGRVMGAIELTWAGGGAIGVPLLGALIPSLGWRAPFVALAVAVSIVAGLTLLLVETPRVARRPGDSIRWSAILQNRSAISLLLVWFMLFFAFENVQIGYGSWLASQFELNVAERGNVAVYLGVFEVIAELGVVLVVDRIGKKRSVTGSLVVALLGYVLLFGAGSTALWLALAALAISFFGFEFSVVAGISIVSEQMPTARGTMLALGVTAGGLGRTLGDVVGGALLEGSGYALVAVVSAVIALATLVLFVQAVRE